MTKIVFRSGGGKVDRKTEILQAARTSFETFGYKATTVEQVAKIAKVGKGTVYNFFLNKEELLEEVVIRMIQQMIAETEATVDPNISFTENAQNTLRNILKYRKNHMLFAKLIEEEKRLQTPAVLQMLRKIENEILHYLAAKIELAVKKGELRPCNTKLVAYLLFKAYVAFIVDWPMQNDEELDEETITTLMQETIIRGLLV